MALASFAAGITEAALLVIVANLAFTIGSRGDLDAIAAGLGPIGSIQTSVRTSFLIALALCAVRALFSLWSAAIAARLTAVMTSEMRAGTFTDFIAASWAEQSRRSESDVQDLLQRHVNKATNAIGLIAQGIGTACTVVALLASAVLVDPVSAALLVVSGAVLFTAIRPFSNGAKRLARMQIEAGRTYARLALEAIGTSLEVRSFGVSQEVSEQLETASEAEVKPIQRSYLLKQVVTVTYQTATVLLLLSGLLAVYTVVDRPLASLGAIVVILVRALNQAGGFQGTYHSLAEIEPFIRRIGEQRELLRASTPRSGDRTLQGASDLACRGVHYSYDGATPALVDLTFDVHRGEAIGIIGPSGSGKSTLIQILLRLRVPDQGEYLVDGTDAWTYDERSWFDQIAFVPQESRLIDDTVAANIAFHREGVSRADIEEAARRAHIHDEIMAMPAGYDTVLGSRGGAVSGGQRQRLCIARALVRRPSILVLDEPTSALDLRSEALVHETFTQLKGTVTIFAIAHRLSTLNSCDRIMVMGGGRLQAFGTRTELERDSAFYRDALRLSQLRTDDPAA
jgi:ABC-type multidrug transport system fused ATPase/permease subunit